LIYNIHLVKPHTSANDDVVKTYVQAMKLKCST